MEVPQKKIRSRGFEAVKEWFEDFIKACRELLDAFSAEAEEYFELGTKQAIEEAIQETKKENPEMAGELDKIQSQLEKQFKTDDVNEKDEDGYYKIPNKVGDIRAEVSEEKAIQEGKQRTKGGKQKTRVDED